MFMTLLTFAVVIGILIFIHEFGHFSTARKLGIAVEEFGFGFPPRLFGIKRGPTTYSINWIPFGGFVRIRGESAGASHDPSSFASRPFGQRTFVIASGVIMNALLGAVLLSFVFAVGVPTSLDGRLPNDARIRDARLQILEVSADSPAARAGLQAGDAVLSVDGTTVTSFAALQEYNDARRGVEESLLVRRNDETLALTVTPDVTNDSDGHPVWGVALIPVGTLSLPWYLAIVEGAKQATTLLWDILVAFGTLVKNLVVHQQVPADVTGPVGIAALTGQVAQLGFIALLQFMALLSLNLAILNILPLPALDGGRIALMAIEKIRGKRIAPRVENMVHSVGFFVLVGLLLLVTVRDVSRYTGAITQFFSGLFGT